MKQLCIFFFAISFCQKNFGQVWVPLASNEQTSNSIASTAAATFFTQISSDGTPYVSYIDDVGNGNNLGDFKVHARKLNNGQWQFAGDAISPAFPGSDNFPVTVDGDVPYVAYSEALNPADLRSRLTVKRLNSNTQTWEVVGQQGISDGPATGMAITSDNGKIFVAYSDGTLDDKVTVKVFDNAHASNGWQIVGTQGFSNGFVLDNNIVIDSGIPYVIYLDLGDRVVYVKKFNGTAWEDVGTNSPTGGLVVAVRSLKFNSAHVPFITFVDADGEGVVRNLNSANAWETTGNGAFATGVEFPVTLTILNDIIFVAFGKKQNGITQVNVKRFNASNNTWGDAGTQPVTASLTTIDNIALVTSNDNKLLMAFRNQGGGLYAKMFDAGSILPVSLTNFNVTQQENKVFLKWTTTSEQDNKLFEIERSTDAVNFKKIGEVLADGNTAPEHNYSFSDGAPSKEINYYRLKEVDKNGAYTYSKIISVAFNQHESFVITLSPNPVNNVLHITNLIGEIKKFFISSAEGKIVRRFESSSNSIDINVASLSKGIYFISFYGANAIKTKSFTKQ